MGEMMLVDLHSHTTVSSGCSVLEPERLIEAARSEGLDAVCVTDHFSVEGANVTQQLGREMGFPVFRGVEARTDLGDMLVFGYYRDIPEGISLEDLCWKVHQGGGLVFAAHPFHTGGGPSLSLALEARGLDLSDDWARVEILRELDGVETVNGQAGAEANARAEAFARRLGIPGIGGSDAHASGMVGTAATRFEHPVCSDHELVAALEGCNGGYSAVRLSG
mgnify:CR=1 FL=1